MPASFIRTHILDVTDQAKSIAIVDVNGSEVSVEFWYSLLNVMTKGEVKEFLCAEALKQSGLIEEAHQMLIPNATGVLIKDPNLGLIDTRNWRQNWIDSYPIMPKIISDPLL